MSKFFDEQIDKYTDELMNHISKTDKHSIVYDSERLIVKQNLLMFASAVIDEAIEQLRK